MVGLDIVDEAEKRIAEKDKDYDKIFSPRLTAYTNSKDKQNTDNKGGRPEDITDLNQGKNLYDKEYNKNARGG